MLFLGLPAEALAVLAGGALVAGWVDAVVGGGGLILIPLIMAVAPELAPAVAVATNKVAVICGTGSAAVTLMRKARPPVHLLRYYLPVAVVCAMAGAATTSLVPAEVMRPLVIVLMLAAGLVVAANPSLGRETSAPLPGRARRLLALVALAVLCYYDGMFGPGSGVFFIMIFAGILARDFLASAALAKTVNTATAVGGLAVFIATGHVAWGLALVLAAANVVGAQLGARTVIAGGTRFLRAALLVVVVVMGGYLSWQQWG